jgi:WD40 repeat protein
MVDAPLRTLVRQLRRLATCQGTSVPGDAELLERFVASRDNAAFELLVWRHGPMVLAEFVNGAWELRANISAVVFSPDGKTLATVEDSGHRIRLWDVPAGKLQRTLEGLEHYIHAVAFAPDGKALACAWDGGGVKLWDPRTGELKRTLETNYKQTLAVAFAPDGKTLATGGSVEEGGEVKDRITLWDARSGERVRDLPSAGFYLCTAVAFAPDGRTLAGALAGERRGQEAGEVRLWPLK